MKVDIQRVSVETVVDHYIRDIQKDPKRAIRNLIDFGAQFSKGRFQKQFFYLSRRMMNDGKSKYYDLVKKLVNTVDAEKIKGFGINMGLNVFTRGACKIRAREEEVGYNIPWCLTLHVAENGMLTPSRIDNLIREGMAEGIYAYHMFIEDAGVDLSEMLDVMARYETCAFIAHVMPQLVTPENAERFAALKNTAFSVYLGEDVGRAVELLQKKRCVCSLSIPYGENETKKIGTNAFLSLPFLANCIFAVFIAKSDCPLPEREQMRSVIRTTRDSGNPPLFLVDFYSDCLYVDEIISDDRCFLGIGPDGTVTRCEELREVPTGQSLQGQTLHDILKKHKPKCR